MPVISTFSSSGELSAYPSLHVRLLTVVVRYSSLCRDHRFEVEKEQALRLIRALLSLPDTDRPVPASVIRAIVAIAENLEEKLRIACLETLGELCMLTLAPMATGG